MPVENLGVEAVGSWDVLRFRVWGLGFRVSLGFVGFIRGLFRVLSRLNRLARLLGFKASGLMLR